jgi:hypothetical protein
MRQWFVLLFVLLLTSLAAGQGQATVYYKTPLESRSLAGDVKSVVGERLADIKVEVCTQQWRDVIASTMTDAHGAFFFPSRTGRLFYLRFSAPGFNTTMVKVRITKSAKKKKLVVNVPVAT